MIPLSHDFDRGNCLKLIQWLPIESTVTGTRSLVHCYTWKMAQHTAHTSELGTHPCMSAFPAGTCGGYAACSAACNTAATGNATITTCTATCFAATVRAPVLQHSEPTAPCHHVMTYHLYRPSTTLQPLWGDGSSQDEISKMGLNGWAYFRLLILLIKLNA